MRSRAASLRLLTVAALALAAAGPASAQTPLRWDFKDGESVKYRFHQKNDMMMTFNNMTNRVLSELTLDLTWTSKGKDSGGNFVIEQTLDRAEASGEVPGPMGKTSFKFESGKPIPEDPTSASLANLYGAVVGKTYTLTLSPRGELVKASIPEAVKRAIPDGIPPAMKDAGSVFSEAGVKAILDQILVKFPEAPAKTWTDTIRLSMPPFGKLVLANTYTDQGAQGGVERFDLKLKTSLEGDANSNIQMKLGSQSGEGVVRFDAKAKKLVETKFDLNLELEVQVNNQTIPQKIKIAAQFNRVGS